MESANSRPCVVHDGKRTGCRAGNAGSLGESGRPNRLVLNLDRILNRPRRRCKSRLDATAPVASPSGFSFAVESRASFPNCLQSVALWNHALGVYEFLNGETLAISDDVVEVIVRSNPGRFIQPSTNAVRALLTYRAQGPAFQPPPWSPAWVLHGRTFPD